MEKILAYIEKNQQRYVDELFELLRIPSVSAEPKNSGDVLRCADRIEEFLRDAGVENVKTVDTGGFPFVYGDWLHAKGAPTILIYGHYDVQPVDPIAEWKNPPFEPVIKNGFIHARGVADDKGQIFAHIKAVEAHLKNGGLPVNVKFLVEGEEEGMAGHIDDVIEKHKNLLKCDAVLISDSHWFSKDLPSMCYALRGISYFEITVRGPKKDLHSGTYGGMIMNPLNALAYIISKLQDENGHILVPGFYDDVLPLTDSERAEFKKLPYKEKEFCAELGIRETWGEKGYTSLERNWVRPSMDVHGIIGGYTGAGPKTVISTHASAKISSRLVPNQDPEKIKALYEDYIQKITPPGVSVEFQWHSMARPVIVPYDNKYVQAASKAFEATFGKKPVFIREGASIPITITFSEILKAPSVLCGIGLPGDNLHAPNERFSLSNFQRGIPCFAAMYSELAKV